MSEQGGSDPAGTPAAEGDPGEGPDVCVCIPYYRGSDVIDRCVASVAMQVLPEDISVEIVVAADTYDGVDGTALDRVSSRYGAVVHRNTEPLGLSGNWDRALRLGRGRIRTLLHQDDWYHPECLAEMLEAFADPSTGFVALSAVSFSDGGTKAVELPRRGFVGELDAAEFKELLLRFSQVPAPSQAFFRSDALSALDPLYSGEYSYCPEFDLYLRLAEANPDSRFEVLGRRLVNRTSAETQYGKSSSHFRLLDYCSIFTEWIQGQTAVERALKDQVHVRILSTVGRLFGAIDTVDIDRFIQACEGADLVGQSDSFWSLVESQDEIAAEFVHQIAKLAEDSPNVPVTNILLSWADRGWGGRDLIDAAIQRHRSVSGGREVEDDAEPTRMTPTYPGKPFLRRPVLIAGFHHSGTRLLAQILDDVGVFQPTTRSSPTHEWRFLQLVDSLLLPRWNDPDAVQAFDPEKANHFIDHATILYRLWAAGYDGDRPWGFKDPRIGPVLGSWLAAYPQAAVVHIVRDPIDAIGTLGAAYAGFSPEGLTPQEEPKFWCDLWEAVTDRTLGAAAEASTFVGIRFEDLVTNPESTLEIVLSGLDCGLRQNRGATAGIQAGRVGAHTDWLAEGRVDRETIALIAERLDGWRARYGYSEAPSLAGAAR